MKRVWEESAQSGSGLLVLLSMADRADDDGYCWPGMEDIAARARVDKRQAQRIVKAVEEAGELYVERSRGRGRTSQYIVATGQQVDQIANTLVRRFEMDATLAVKEAAEMLRRQAEIKGDIQGQKVTYIPPFDESEKGDIQGLKGDIQREKVTSSARKGDIPTTPTIIEPSLETNESSKTTNSGDSGRATVGGLFDFWQQNFPGSLTPLIADDLNDLIDDYGIDEVQAAATTAVRMNKRFIRYVAGVCRNRAAGIDYNGETNGSHSNKNHTGGEWADPKWQQESSRIANQLPAYPTDNITF